MTKIRLSELVKQDLSIDPEITGVTSDSRKVAPGFLFAALPGTQVDGAAFIPAALKAGAAAILAADSVQGLSAPTVHAIDPRRAYALAASVFWGHQPNVVVAVTGTNGKTSVATFCRQIFAAGGYAAASLGTLGVCTAIPTAGTIVEEQLTGPGLTTSDAAELAQMMARLAMAGVTHAAMEASSHGIDQRRLDGVTLTAAGFLNLTQDHLDYHGTMDAYRAAKLRLFDTLLPRGRAAILNADSEAFPAFAAAAVTSGHTVMSVGAMGQSLTLTERTLLVDGQRLRIRHLDRDHDILLPLAGAFQAGNAMVAAGLCIAAGQAPDAVFAALEKLEGAPGRLQRVGTGALGGEAYVDYAHTPDGLRTVLAALRPHASGRLIVVVGAGGDRDRGKRPQMGAIADDLADIAIVTDDNPRNEEPREIRAEVLAGGKNLREIANRRQAIGETVALLRHGDVLVVAGKGHEQGQLVAGKMLPFDDVAETRAALEATHG